MLRRVVILTPAFGLLFRLAVPPMADALTRRFGFELVAYCPLLMSFLPLIAAGMTGPVVGFLLLDQRDDQTLMALLVTPLSFRDYLWYRLSGLMVLSAVPLLCRVFPERRAVASAGPASMALSDRRSRSVYQNRRARPAGRAPARGSDAWGTPIEMDHDVRGCLGISGVAALSMFAFR